MFQKYGVEKLVSRNFGGGKTVYMEVFGGNIETHMYQDISSTFLVMLNQSCRCSSVELRAAENL